LNDQGTRQLLSQLAKVVPLGSSLSTVAAKGRAFEEAQKEAIRGLKKPKDMEAGSSTLPVRKKRVSSKAKGKGKVQQYITILFL
jgi:hypothetical protein